MKSLLATVLAFIISCNSDSAYEGRAYTAAKKTSEDVAAEPHDHAEVEETNQNNEVASNTTEEEKAADEEKADEPPAAPPAPPADPNIVLFNIKAGTAGNAYNTKAEAVVVKVGQKLRVTNMDTAVHRIHTGGAPFPHGDNIAAGATVEYTIASPLDITNLNAAPTYDHAAGTAASFWIQANP